MYNPLDSSPRRVNGVPIAARPRMKRDFASILEYREVERVKSVER